MDVVQQADGVLSNVWAEVRVAFGHHDRRVPHQFLNRLDGRLAHNQVAGKGVTEHVPPDAS